MKVKAIIAHSNVYGETYEKNAGDMYELPDSVGEALIASEIVERVDPLDHDGDGRKGGARKVASE